VPGEHWAALAGLCGTGGLVCKLSVQLEVALSERLWRASKGKVIVLVEGSHGPGVVEPVRDSMFICVWVIASQWVSLEEARGKLCAEQGAVNPCC
jgi:hypothetical protein